MARARREAAEGSLSPIYREAPAVVPRWDKPSTRKFDDEARRQQLLKELQNIRPAGSDCPRHQN